MGINCYFRLAYKKNSPRVLIPIPLWYSKIQSGSILNLMGIFIYESGCEPTPDAEDGCRKLGVQLTPIDTVLNEGSPNVYVRRLLQGTENITRDRFGKYSRYNS